MYRDDADAYGGTAVQGAVRVALKKLLLPDHAVMLEAGFCWQIVLLLVASKVTVLRVTSAFIPVVLLHVRVSSFSSERVSSALLYVGSDIP